MINTCFFLSLDKSAALRKKAIDYNVSLQQLLTELVDSLLGIGADDEDE